MATYSLMDVVGGIDGPGGAFSIGSDAGLAEEGITLEADEDKNTMTKGGGGSIMHSLHAAKSGTATIRLLKTSPVNRLLGQLYDFQTSSSANHGQNMITIRDKARGDVAVCRQAAFKKRPTLTYAKEGGIMEWVFDVGILDETLGSGSPAV